MNTRNSIDSKEYSQIIDSLAITFIKARHIQLLQSLTVKDFQDVENTLILLNNGQITCLQADKKLTVEAGDMLFIASGQPVTLTYGSSSPVTLNNNDLIAETRQYFQVVPATACTTQCDNFSYITFDARIFNTANLFRHLGAPAFVIKGDVPLYTTLSSIFIESHSQSVGRSRMLKAYTEQLVIEIFRYLVAKNLFVREMTKHMHHFNNSRIISILDYIQRKLHSDLSNRVLAAVANVTEDYLGQFFKMHTGCNPQDYIEYQRMEQAVKLLRTTPKSINDISRAVGFKDPAYFCRRFKMKFGISAGKLRNGEMAMRNSQRF